MTDDEFIEQITQIRATNNKLWMELLKHALASEPVATKSIMRQIADNDKSIHELTRKLVDED